MAAETGVDTLSPLNDTQCRMTKDAGYGFIIRYYRSSHSRWHPLTHDEAARICSAGLKIAVVWEYAGDKLSSFSYTNGYDEGTSAYRQALNVGQPSQSPIYFAVDFDANPTETAGACRA